MDERELIEILTPFNFWRTKPFTGVIRPDYLNLIIGFFSNYVLQLIKKPVSIRLLITLLDQKI